MPVSLKQFLSLIILFSVSQLVSAQSDLNSELNFGSSFYLNPSGTTNELPFWLHVNKNGVVNQYSSNAMLYSKYRTNIMKRENFSLDAGAHLFANYSEDPSVHFNILYAKTKYKGWILSMGRFIDPLAKKEDDLSIGSFMVSNNATPIPKIALQTDEFLAIPHTNGVVGFKAYYSHGWFENNRYTKNLYLHQKYLYLNIKYSFFDLIGGIVHNVQWGGENERFGKLPSDLRAYWEVVSGLSASSEDAPSSEKSNVIGNSLSVYDFSMGLNFKAFEMRLYRVFYLEDKVSTRFRSPWDGTWGLTIKPKDYKYLNTFLVEHINTKRQDSFDNRHPYGRAKYYSHSVYQSGWTYENRVIGMPLILFDRGGKLANNIIIGYNVGLAGEVTSDLEYKFLGTYTRNYGICYDQVPLDGCYFEKDQLPKILIPLSEFRKDQYSLYFDLTYTVPKNPDWRISGGFSTDLGQLYSNKVGIYFGVEKSIIP